jgi:hypothetical protein
MMSGMTRFASHAVLFVTAAIAVGGCVPATAQTVPLIGTSKTMTVKGQYQPLRIDEVDGVALKGAQLVVRGSFESVTIDLPTMADPTKATRHWALVTESSVGAARLLNFTHDESLDDFTLEVPASDGDIRYGVFVSRTGGEVMVLAWGSEAKCYWAYVTIDRLAAATSPPGR